MSTFSKSVGGTRIICVWSPGVTATALEALEKHIRHRLVDPNEFTKAHLCYKDLASDRPDEPDEYPLKFYSEDGKTELWLSGISTGYRGTGPHGASQMLMLMGFDIDPERDVFSLPQGQEKVFEKKKQ